MLLASRVGGAGLGSAALFGVGFTTGFALVVIWSQQVFHDRPTTGFTLAIVVIVAGFIIGPSLFGVLATHVGRPAALLTAAAPALLVALVPPSRDDRLGPPRPGQARRCGVRVSRPTSAGASPCSNHW